jgi:transposase-like protein
MFSYKIDHLLDEDKSYAHLLELIHENRLGCPRCGSGHQRVHSYQRAPILTYQCKACHKFYNLFTNTVFQGTHYSCSVVVMIIRGVSQGASTSQLSQELGVDYTNLLKLRHRMQQNAYENLPISPLSDAVTETDEMFQNAGEKGRLHPDPEDPPRRRANKKKGMARMPMTAPPS